MCSYQHYVIFCYPVGTSRVDYFLILNNCINNGIWINLRKCSKGSLEEAGATICCICMNSLIVMLLTQFGPSSAGLASHLIWQYKPCSCNTIPDHKCSTTSLSKCCCCFFICVLCVHSKPQVSATMLHYGFVMISYSSYLLISCVGL